MTWVGFYLSTLHEIMMAAEVSIHGYKMRLAIGSCFKLLLTPVSPGAMYLPKCNLINASNDFVTWLL